MFSHCPILYAALSVIEQIAPERISEPRQCIKLDYLKGRPLYDAFQSCLLEDCSWWGNGCPQWTAEEVAKRRKSRMGLKALLDIISPDITKQAANRLEKEIERMRLDHFFLGLEGDALWEALYFISPYNSKKTKAAIDAAKERKGKEGF